MSIIVSSADLTQPLSGRVAFDHFRAACAWSRSPSKPGLKRPISAGSERAIISTAMSALRFALRREGAPDPADEEVLAHPDIRPYLPVLPAFARMHARERDHQAPSDAASRAKKFYEAMVGRPFAHRICGPERFISDAFRPLLDAGVAVNEDPAGILFVQRVCMLAGYHDAPARIPTHDEWISAAKALGFCDGGVRQAQTAYRKAAAHATERDPAMLCAPLYRKVSVRETLNGLRIEHLLAKCRLLRAELKHFKAKGRGKDLSYAWQDAVEAAVAHTIAALMRAGWTDGQLRQLTSKMLLLLTRVSDVPSAVVEDAYEEPDDLDDDIEDLPSDFCGMPTDADADVGDDAHVGRAGDGDAGSPDLERRRQDAAVPAGQITMLEWLLDREAPDGRRRCTPPRETGYTGVQLRDVKALYCLIQSSYRRKASATEWLVMRARYKLLERSVRMSVVAGGTDIKNKLLAIQTMTLPQLVCVGLPWYDRYVVEPAKRRWEQATLDAVNAGHAPQSHSGVKKARKEYCAVLERYCATAIALDDGLRIKQYANGRWGYHFIGTWESGKLVEVVTNWYGDKRDAAGLKITEKKQGLIPTERFGRPLRHSFVNYERLETYLLVFREERLRASGALAPDEPFSVDDSRFALFATVDAPRNGKRRRMVSSGAYNRDHVSVQLIGITLHQIARDCLGRDVPAWDDLTGDAATKWWGIWSAHITRLLVASYWNGVHANDEGIASYLTLDESQALDKDYTVCNNYLRDRLGGDTSHWEHPKAYDRWMLAMYTDWRIRMNPLDDPTLPLPPTTLAFLKAEAAKALASKRRRRKDGVRVRRRRPGQTLPEVGTGEICS